MSVIDDKHTQLKEAGLDLGAPLDPEGNEHSGGLVRRYQNGNIYFHPNTGAHEVHGGILALYLANGGPGPSPVTGRRELGYPTTDEVPGTPPRSMFELGEIYWTRGTGGCVVSGAIWNRYRQGLDIGLPVTSNIPIAGGEAAFFERGVIYARSAAGKTRVVAGFLTPPLIGQPEVVTLDEQPGRTIAIGVRWAMIMREDHDAIVGAQPNAYAEVLQTRYSIAPTGKPSALVPLLPSPAHVSGTFQVDVTVRLSVPPEAITDRTLYDLWCALPNGSQYAASPHCWYAKRSWDDFGLLHITDLHISKRNDEFRTRLQQAGLSDAARNYSNFQDNFRDFIRYANKLHDLGLADAVLATGDLVDYAREEGDTDRNTNFTRLRDLLLGRHISGGSPAGEELRLPFFATMGNHDYRVNPYYLRANFDPPLSFKDMALNEYGSHNLLESDAISLQAERTPTFGLLDAEEGLRQLKTDQSRNAYSEFDGHINRTTNFVVKLGRNRLVVLDSQMDDGVPEDVDAAFLIQLLSGTANESTERLLSGRGPNSVGFGDVQIRMIRTAVQETGDEGVVIVGMHAPAISPAGGEYPLYLRESIHPAVSPDLVTGFLARHGLNGATWPRAGTPYFKTGTTADGLDVGIGWNRNREFLEACAGVGLDRPVDLILCGHVHRYVEHRFRHTGSGFEFYTDFYTENPRQWYPTRNQPGLSDLPDGAPIIVEVVEGAPLPASIGQVRDHRAPARATESIPPTISGRARTRPYADPLENAADPRDWWKRHRPLHAQTSSLGPIDNRQRFGTFYRITNPDPACRPVIESDRGFVPGAFESLEVLPRPFVAPTFQGFRLAQVKGNVIERMRYITLADLRAKDFTLPWEPQPSVNWQLIHGQVSGTILRDG